MTRHVFDNTASPAVANYGFRKVVQIHDNNVNNLFRDNFNVNDGLVSCKIVEKYGDLVHHTKQTLHDNEIWLSKLASNSRRVLDGL